MMGVNNLDEIKCPSCGGTLEKGNLFGHFWRIRWSTKENKFWAFTGEPLGKRTWTAPKLEAARCQKCRIGIFRY